MIFSFGYLLYRITTATAISITTITAKIPPTIAPVCGSSESVGTKQTNLARKKLRNVLIF